MPPAAIADARAEGLDPRDLATAIYAAAAPDAEVPEARPASATAPTTTICRRAGAAVMPDLDQDSDKVPVRRELRRQIEKLETALAAYPESLTADGRAASRASASRPTSPESASSSGRRNRLVDRVAEFGALAEHRRDRAASARACTSRRWSDDPAAHKWERVEQRADRRARLPALARGPAVQPASGC